MKLTHADGLSPLDLQEAIEISRLPKSVAITVWDAAHNPVGRAKVLYDVVAAKRPAVLFGFCHSEFGEGLWAPLRSSSIHVCLVQPDKFDTFRRKMRSAGASFDTIWMCKPRLPTFVLAEALAHQGTAFILDIDDNEDAFSRSAPSRGKWYGEESANLARLYLHRFRVRSVASASLQAQFGGAIVRHGRFPSRTSPLYPPNGRKEKSLARTDTEQQARERAAEFLRVRHDNFENGKNESPSKERAPHVPEDKKPPFRLVFIGTVHMHKGLVEAARGVRMASLQSGIDIRLVVGGTFHPPEIKAELQSHGVEIMGVPIPLGKLQDKLRKFDAVLTGFPTDSMFDEVNRYQISSKIGDALSVGLPALVPRTEAVEDLANVPGVLLFERQDFRERLIELTRKPRQQICLPDQFNVRSQYKIFARLEAEAKAQVSGKCSSPRLAATTHLRKVLLVWKQPDAGVYGRRVDQIARALAKGLEGVEVTVAEMVSAVQVGKIAETLSLTSDSGLLQRHISMKAGGYVDEGVIYRNIYYDRKADSSRRLSAREAFRSFLDENGFYPESTVAIVFPTIQEFEAVFDPLLPFTTVVDVVDNEILPRPDAVGRVSRISQIRAWAETAYTVVFNSRENMRFMIENGICSHDKSFLIKNWYSARGTGSADASPSVGDSLLKGRTNVIYSGNMNDRVDWDLLEQAALEIKRVGALLHLIGGAQRVGDNIRHLLRNSACIYHGPLQEADSFPFANRCDFAIVPHMHDVTSTFMDPLKVKMYETLHLPHIITTLPGLEQDSVWRTVASDHVTFLEALRDHLANARVNPRLPHSPAGTPSLDQEVYCNLVRKCLVQLESSTLNPASGKSEP